MLISQDTFFVQPCSIYEESNDSSTYRLMSILHSKYMYTYIHSNL
jgi:hypothetical protein